MAGGSMQPRGGIIQGINVTPLVDITLVLLIIFIVTAKTVVPQAVPLDLPKAASAEAIQTIFAVSIKPDGDLFVDGVPCSDTQLVVRAEQALKKDGELRAVIQADGDVPHRRVMGVLDALKSTGLERVAFGALRSDSAAAVEETASPQKEAPE